MTEPIRGFVLLSLSAAAHSQPPEASKKYAPLVGVNEYEHDKLKKLQFAVNDVREMAELLRKNGYAVTVLSVETGRADEKLRPTKANIERELKSVMGKTRKGDLLLAFAGHGLQFEDQKDCFFCPSDARPFKASADSRVSLSKVYEDLEQSFAGMKVRLVDACRDDPEATRGSRGGINADNSPRPPQGVAALFSCRAGELAREHDELKHGVFFHHMTWDEAQAFAKAINEREKQRNTGWVYRLPTEAEWEYACRGWPHGEKDGRKTAPFYFAKPTISLSSRQANIDGNQPYGEAPRWNSVGGPAKIGSYEPNSLGIYDMHGNVSEWCDAVYLATTTPSAAAVGCRRRTAAARRKSSKPRTPFSRKTSACVSWAASGDEMNQAR